MANGRRLQLHEIGEGIALNAQESSLSPIYPHVLI